MVDPFFQGKKYLTFGLRLYAQDRYILAFSSPNELLSRDSFVIFDPWDVRTIHNPNTLLTTEGFSGIFSKNNRISPQGVRDIHGLNCLSIVTKSNELPYLKFKHNSEAK